MMGTSDIIAGGLRPIREAYWQDIRDYAAEIVAEYPDDEDARDTAIHETADGSAWVIYTREAYLVALVSDNADAAEDELGRDALIGDSIDHIVTVAAYFAMRADLTAQVESLLRVAV